MIPSVVATQLQDTLVDYILATLAFEDEDFTAAFEGHLRGPDGLFRGPYLRLGLPFADAGPNEDIPLTIRPTFTPYAHQLQAFQQLSTRSEEPPRNTLVTTGTGSGKTECFLYPVLDHCYRHRDRAGVQAILIYPMNALATDQARRLAGLIAGDERLHGLRAGLYVGGQEKGLPTQMSPDRLIEDKATLRNEPPHILLTNYKMLDFMLLRPDERRLWLHNGPETLRYLVIDELHTFDGAQGSDVGCLVRRLKTRLETPEGHLVCAGTSATIGSSTDSATFSRLADFAAEVFDEPFDARDVVRERRLARAEFLLPTRDGPVLPDVGPAGLEPDAFIDPAAWLAAQQRAWLGEVLAPIGLGQALRAHPFLNHLLRVAAATPATFTEVDAALSSSLEGWADAPTRLRQLRLASFLALVSHARREVGDQIKPLLTVQVQLWSRELTRLLRSLPDQAGGASTAPRFAWWTDIPGEESPEGTHAPQAHCRECGIVGLAGCRSEKDLHDHVINFHPATVGEAWLRASRTACFIWPRPLDPAERVGELVHWLHPEGGRVHSTQPIDPDGTARGAPVRIDDTLRERGGDKHFAARCPACGTDDALSIVGARAASLSSVAVTQLFQTRHNQDKKLLAFTDSVQDACHRAGFFGGRTFRIHLRTAIQAVVSARSPLPLSEAAEAFEQHWRARKGDLHYVSSFLPPDLRELPEYLRWIEKEGKGSHKRLWSILRERLGWEITREFGVAANIGRSLERSAASTAQVEPDRFAAAVERFEAWYREQPEARPEADPSHFLRGLVLRMRTMGAVHHRYLDEYVRSDGNRYLLSKRKNPHMSPVGPRSKRIRFVSTRPRKDVFQSPFGRRAGTSWYGDWARRALLWLAPGPDALGRIYGQALAILTDVGVLRVERGAAGSDVWGVEPAALLLTTSVGAVQSGHRGRVYHLPEGDADAADGQCSWAFRAESALRRVDPEVGYYADVYNQGETTRVFPGEHTGLLKREARVSLEERFLTGATPEDPQAPNLLVATPTLEMGVDIGDLSAAMLCSVPPTPANYLQRIGRAGRKTGNAFIFTLATAQPHDMYFHAEPVAMLDGVVEPPGIFLGATAMLRRQLSAWCMDRWARDDDQAGPVPRKTNLVLNAGRERFPGRMLAYVARNGEALVDGFLGRFGGPLSTESRDALRAWIAAPAQGMEAAFQGAFDEVKAQIDGYVAERRKASERIKKIEADPTAVANAEEEVRELKRYRATLGYLIDALRDKYPLNVLADASLLPNYAFPESGVKLHSRLGTDEASEDDAKGKPKRTYEKREYVRPAARALRELAPFNTFYAEGHKVEIRELDLGPKASRVEHWRFCPSCHHRRRAIDPTKPPPEGACPRCGDPHWVDTGQVRPMLPMNTVRSVADRVRSTTADDTEERAQESFQILQLFDVRPENIDGEAVLLRDLGFGFEYLREVTLTEVNFGLTATLEGAQKVRIAGDLASAEGFPTCRNCGTVEDPRHAARRSGPPGHSPFCPQKGGDTKPREPLSLFREVRSEAVRFLLPFSEVQVEPKLRSFQAAVAFGLRRTFGGRPIHLQIAVMSEPSPTDREVRKHFLVLFDSVPGGTGYLRDYRSRRAVFDLLEDAVEGLRSCSCRARGRDGCYLCLFGHQSQKHLPILSSKLAEETLDKVLAARHTAEVAEGGLSTADVAAVLESELEERFVAALELRFGEALTAVEGGAAWELRAGDTVWRLDTQVWLDEVAGEPMRTDFLFTAIQGPGLGERVAVECDGYEAHVQPAEPSGRVASDLRKRGAVAAAPGWRMFQLTWHDLSTNPDHLVPSTLCGVPDQVWAVVYPKATKGMSQAVREVLVGLPSMAPLRMLWSYLEHPGPHWSRGVAALIGGRIASAAKAKRLIEGHGVFRVEDHLRQGSPLAPLPPWSLARQVPPGHQSWALAELVGDLAVLVRAKGAALRTFDPEGVEVLARLDDRWERRRDPEFAASWRAMLQALNLAWLLPGTEALSDEGLALDLEVEGVDVLAGLGLPAAAAQAGVAYASASDLETVLASCFDDAGKALVRAVYETRLPLPDIDRPEVADCLIPDLAWSELRIAVLDPEQAEPEDLERARRDGWTVLLLPIEDAVLTTALRNAAARNP